MGGNLVQKKEPEKPYRFFHFDPTVNTGHLMMTSALLVSVLTWGLRLESRVDHEVDLRVRIEKRIDEDATRSREQQRDLADSLRRIDDRLQAITETLPRPPVRPQPR